MEFGKVREKNARKEVFRLVRRKAPLHPFFAFWVACAAVRAARNTDSEAEFEAHFLDQAVGSPFTDILIELWVELKPLLIEVLKQLLGWLIDVIPTVQDGDSLTPSPANLGAVPASEDYVTYKGRDYRVTSADGQGREVYLELLQVDD